MPDFASASAMALNALSNPTTMATVGVGAGVAVVATAVAGIAYVVWKHGAEKHQALIDAIGQLHRDHLSKIDIPEHNEKITFPPIFGTDDGKFATVNYSKAAVEAILENVLKTGGSTSTNDYRNAICDSLRLLIIFRNQYKNDPTNLTITVIDYLIFILQTYCRDFSACVFDIAYIKALSKFINYFVDLYGKGDPESNHAAGLNPVIAALTRAVLSLEKQHEHLTQGELIERTYTACRVAAEKLHINLVKFITPSKHWDALAPLNIIQTGNITISSVTRFGFGHFHWIHDPEVMPDSELTDLTKQIIRYYLESIDSDVVTPPQRPDFDFNMYESAPLPQKTIDLLKKPDTFLTTKIDPNPPHLRFVPITDPKELIPRVKLFKEHAKICELMSSFLYALTYVASVIQHLGEEEASDPAKFKDIYYLHDKLCTAIKTQIRVLRSNFTKIRSLNNFFPQQPDKQDFYESQLDLLKSIETIIKNHTIFIQERREQLAFEQAKITVATLKSDIHNVVNSMCKTYGFMPPPPTSTPPRTPDNGSATATPRVPQTHRSRPPAPTSKPPMRPATIVSTGQQPPAPPLSEPKVVTQTHKAPLVPPINVNAPPSPVKPGTLGFMERWNRNPILPTRGHRSLGL